METFAPTTSQLLLMISAFILVVIILFWRRFAPRGLRSKLVFDSAVKKAWILLATEDQRIAFTHLMLDAVKSDGKVTADEAEALYEEMDLEYKKKAAQMSTEKMYEVLRGCDSEQKENIQLALSEMLISDGDFDPKEKAWLDGVKKNLA
jgi:uncharacterized tellurite resistance protein B-like protein